MKTTHLIFDHERCEELSDIIMKKKIEELIEHSIDINFDYILSNIDNIESGDEGV
jgi:hypothetical protein